MQKGLKLFDSKHQYQADKAQRKKDFDNCCAYCGLKTKELTIDHVIARSQQGTNDLNNLLPACKKCNESKGSKSLLSWYTIKNYRYTSERWNKIKTILLIA